MKEVIVTLRDQSSIHIYDGFDLDENGDINYWGYIQYEPEGRTYADYKTIYHWNISSVVINYEYENNALYNIYRWKLSAYIG